MHEVMDFGDLEEVTIPVHVKGEAYTLREASGRAAGKYRNACLECTTIGPDGKPTGFHNVADVEPLLVSLCLFDENGRNVPQARIEQWPSRVQKALFNKAKEISDLDEGISAEREQFVKALSVDESPISLQDFREWINKLNPNLYGDLQRWAAPTPEELAKNEQNGSPGGFA